MFRRRRTTDEDSVELDETTELDADDEGADASDIDGLPERPNGPWDSSEIDTDDSYLDLGSMRISGIESMEVRLEVDPGSGAVVAVTVVEGESSVALQAFAAPRREGMWVDIRKEIAGGISSSGGTVDFLVSDFGTELHSVMSVQGPDGKQGRAPVRFVGIDGPRWFLRAVFSGPAATDPRKAGNLEQVVRGLVVVRGSDAMAPGDPLALTMPGEGQPDVSEDAAEREILAPFQRGPEITEIR